MISLKLPIMVYGYDMVIAKLHLCESIHPGVINLPSGLYNLGLNL